ncbi:MAG: hypothetical protein ACK5Q5_00410 [Planctomycetaceae bacterium]
MHWNVSNATIHWQLAVAGATLFGVCAALASPVNPPSPQEVDDLIAHVRGLPPKSYDIEVISEFQLKKVPEQELRKSVINIYDQTDDSAPVKETAEDRSRAIDREVQRLLDEQELPRRIKKWCRFRSDLGYRVEMVTERSGPYENLNTGPVEQSPFRETYINVGEETAVGNNQSVRLDHRQHIASLRVKPGSRISQDHVWTGGTVGLPLAIMLKSALKVGQPEEQHQVDLLLRGEHPLLRFHVLQDIDLPDGTVGRRFVLHVKDGLRSVEVSFDVPKHSFNPVWKVAYPDHVPREVLTAKDGVAQVWIDRETGTPEGGRKYTLISRKLDVDLDADLFAYKAPEGYDVVDHAFNPPKVTYADGRVESGTPVALVPHATGSAESRWMWMVVGNVFIVAGVLLAVFVKRRKTQGQPPMSK